MHKRFFGVSMRLCMALAITGVTVPASMRVAHAIGYLKAAGPTPLRFQTKPVVAPAPAPPAQLAGPEVPTPQPFLSTPAPPPATAREPITAPDVLKSLLTSPLWASLSDGIRGDGFAAGLIRPAFTATTAQLAPAEKAPAVTVEMLADFFKTADPVANAVTNQPAASPPGNAPTAVFVLPSSQATYRSP